MKRKIHWSIVMAVLGFILGLGFLIPLPGGTESRNPASAPAEASFEILPEFEKDQMVKVRSDKKLSLDERNLDTRENVLFDIHTISQSRFVKNTDAYVLVQFVDDSTRDEIESFAYCSNYDYKAYRARPDLDRYATNEKNPNKTFDCRTIWPSRLKEGRNITSTILGPVLTLKSKNFDTRKGGTISIIYAHHIAKIGNNIYRSMDVKVVLKDGIVKLTGPSGEAFDWLNIVMSDDIIGIPTGLTAFEIYNKGVKGKTYDGSVFVRVPPPPPTKL